MRSGSVAIEVSGRRFDIPHECPCCGAPPNAEMAIVAKGTGPMQLFPYCRRCADHAREWDHANVSSTAVMVVAILASVAVAIAVSIVKALAVFVAGAIVAWSVRVWRRKLAEKKKSAACASAELAVRFEGWTGRTNQFSFDSPTFAARFAEANKPLLANVSPGLQRLLDGYHRARLAVPTPAVAAGVAPPPLTASAWRTRLESLDATLERRVQLKRALEMIDDPPARRELIQTVARIELAPLLHRLQLRSSPAATPHLLEMLESALAQVRQDNIPEELQAAEAHELEARIAELRAR